MTAPIHWPRMMKRATAAQYCDLSVASFEAEIAKGTLPAPVMLGNREHWCKKALDRALDILTGDEGEPDYRKELRQRYEKAA